MKEQLVQKQVWLSRTRKLLRAAYWLFRRPIVDLQGIKIPIGPHMSDHMQQAFSNGEYEQAELSIIKANLQSTDRVMELGSGIGFISAYCAKIIGSDRVWTFEANPDLEKHIRNVYRLNKVSPELSMCMLGKKEGTQKFYIDQHFWGSSALPAEHCAKVLMVNVKPFNEAIRRIDPTFLIVDIEGGEYELLKDAEFFNVKKLLIEIHQQLLNPHQCSEVKSKIESCGFAMCGSPSTTRIDVPQEIFYVRA